MQSKEILENCLSFRAKPISFGLSDGQKKKKNSRNLSAADRESKWEMVQECWKGKKSAKSSGEFSYIVRQSKHFNLSIMLFFDFSAFSWHSLGFSTPNTGTA